MGKQDREPDVGLWRQNCVVRVNENGLCLARISVISMEDITGVGQLCKNLLLVDIPLSRARSN